MNNLQMQIHQLAQSQREICDLLLTVAHDQNWRPAEGEWSFREVAAHMRIVEIECWYHRIQRIAAGENPVDTYYYLNSNWIMDQDDLIEVVGEWLRWRQRVGRLVESLSAEKLARTGTHVTFGVVTIPSLLDVAIEHDQEHLRDLRRDIEQWSLNKNQII